MNSVYTDQIYGIYLRYISPEDIHVYSIGECFIDITPYLKMYKRSPKEMAIMLMDAVRAETGICATAGIGTNLFLAKVALDITAKKSPRPYRIPGCGIVSPAPVAPSADNRYLEHRGKFGKNAVLRGINYHEKSTGRKRNTLVGGHNG